MGFGSDGEGDGGGWDEDADEGVRLGPYRIVEELGRGGMGVVYRARHESLGREVALKVLQMGPFASAEVRGRFRREAMTVAALRHPNLVTLYEVGEADGHAFLAMELVEGRSLAEWVRDGPMAPERAARYLAAVAGAVEEAHAHGILHRDLKPGNVMIDARDVPKVTDFGLAKRFEEARGAGPGEGTWEGQVLGSPGYLPPEQADPARGGLGYASDVYALGALLYHLLTGRAPFAASTVTATIAQVLREEPVSPRRLNSGVPVDLETLCLKCLEKEPGRRYARARDLAADLEAYLERRPIAARRVGVWERAALWCRRKPFPAALILALCLVGTAGIGGVLWQARKNRLNLYAADLRLASEAVNVGDLGRARELLGLHPRDRSSSEAGRADFTWRYLKGQSLGDGGRVLGEHPWIVSAVAWSPDGRWLASASVPSGTVGADLRIWEPGQSDGGLRVLSESGARDLVWYPDSRRLMAVHHDGVVRVWDRESRAVLETFPGRSAGISADGKWRVVCEGNPVAWEVYLGGVGTVRVQDLEQGTERALPGARLAVISPDGRWVATTDLTHRVRVYRREDARPVRELESDGEVWSLEFSPDGRRLIATGFDADLRVWRWEEGSVKPERWKGHRAPTWRARFSPDGRRVVSTSSDQTLRAWDVATGEGRGLWRGHGNEVWAVSFHPDGQGFASGGKDRQVRVWNGVPPARDRTWESREYSPALLSWDGRWAVTTAVGDTTRTWVHALLGETDGTAATGRVWVAGVPAGITRSGMGIWVEGAQVRHGELSRGGTVESGARLEEVPGPAEAKHWVGLGVEVRWLAGAGTGWVAIWDRGSGRKLREFEVPGLEPWGLRGSDDGRWVAAVGGERGIWLGQVGDGRQQWIRGHRDMAKDMAFSGDGRMLATASVDATIKLWRLPGAEEVATLRGHMTEVTALAFAPDGVTLASCEFGRGLRFWHLPTLREVAILPMPEAADWIGFTGDGGALGVRLSSGRLRMIRAEP